MSGWRKKRLSHSPNFCYLRYAPANTLKIMENERIFKEISWCSLFVSSVLVRLRVGLLANTFHNTALNYLSSFLTLHKADLEKQSAHTHTHMDFIHSAVISIKMRIIMHN